MVGIFIVNNRPETMAPIFCNQRFASPATRRAPLTDRKPFADDPAWLRSIHRRDCGIGRCRWSDWPAINAAERDSIGASVFLPNTIPMSRCPICGICWPNAHAGTLRGCLAASITLTS
jgi:hypothetical protein